MADLSGIILPSGGTYSDRLQYGSNGNVGYNIIPFDPNQANQAIYNQTGNPGNYNTPGYLYGYGDISDPANQAGYTFSPHIDDFVAGGKIIPSQYTQTVAQSVGPAQFSVNGSTTTQGVGSNQTSNPWFSSVAAPSSQTPGPSANTPFLFGNNGSLGTMAGSFGNTNAGQSTPFFQSGPMQATSLPPSQSITPQQQALVASRDTPQGSSMVTGPSSQNTIGSIAPSNGSGNGTGSAVGQNVFSGITNAIKNPTGGGSGVWANGASASSPWAVRAPGY